MQFDIFHSIGRIDSIQPRLNDRQVFENFFAQSELAEELGFDTVWVAESHFSSETQKCHRQPVIPNYSGEVGLNCDSMQLFAWLMHRTQKINLGTAIFNIVGGNGGPIAAADRVRTLAFYNSLLAHPRRLNIGIASGRFPYINAPFGILPRCTAEKDNWQAYQKYIFLEALEIFLRLSLGESISSKDLSTYAMEATNQPYEARWNFEKLKLVPELPARHLSNLQFVLGSHCPLARALAFKWADVDVFNLSFTPPDQIEKIHHELHAKCQATMHRKPWHRARLPRTVLVFIDEERSVAQQRASDCFDTYIAAMQGTAQVPDKNILLQRALIGTPDDIKRQLSPDDPHGFHPDDRLMLWFEFNQAENEPICDQMRLFAQSVMPEFSNRSVNIAI